MASIKNGDDIPDTDHVLRYCSPMHVDGKEIQPGAFQIRDGEQYLSVYWLEFFSGCKSPAKRLNCVRQAISKGIEIKKNGRLAKIHVGATKKRISGINIKYKPLAGGRESHAGIYPKKLSRLALLELSNCISGIYPAILF